MLSFCESRHCVEYWKVSRSADLMRMASFRVLDELVQHVSGASHWLAKPVKRRITGRETCKQMFPVCSLTHIII